jgi:chromosome segregation protein
LHITELEIDNFKSFAKKTKIPFFEGCTVISGPNGSGKSNIIDSLLFGLALTTSRTLRAEKLTDLINLGSGKNAAEVAITLSDGTVIRRRIKRTQNGYYNYNYLNDRLCKQGDIVDLLARYGIKPHGYNVVMQGDITRIIEMSDFERRKIIDEIAGVAEFDQKRDQALAELEIVRERIEREELLLHELTERLSALEKEREDALKYRELSELAEKLEGLMAAALLGAKERESGSLTEARNAHEKEIERISTEKSHLEHEIGMLREDLAELDDEINRKSGSDYLSLIVALEETKNAIKFSRQDIERQKQEKDKLGEAVSRIYLDTKRAETRVRETTDQIRALTIDRTNLSMEVAALKAEYSRIEQEISRLSKDAEGARESLMHEYSTLEERRSDRSLLVHQQDILIEKRRLKTTETERLNNRIQALENDLKNVRKEREEMEKTVEAFESEEKELKKAFTELDTERYARKASLEQIRKEMKDAEREILALEAHRQARGEAYGKAVEAVLSMEGVYGTVAELGRVESRYETALNVAAGGKLGYVICEDDEVAARAIEYLKSERIGRVTFLPLNKLRPVPRTPLREKGIIGYAADLVSHEPLFAKAFGVVFGSTLVVEDLGRARGLMGKYRMVTPEGELIEKSGAMTGGLLKKTSRGFGRSVDDEMNRARSRLSALEEEWNDYEQGLARIEEALDSIRQKRNDLGGRSSRDVARLEELTRQADAIGSEMQSLASEKAALLSEGQGPGEDLVEVERQLESVNRDILDITSRIDEMKRILEGTFLPKLTDDLDQKRRKVEDVERRLRNKDADILDIQRERQHFNARVEELNGERERIATQSAGIDSLISAHNRSILENEGRVAELESRQKAFSAEVEESRKKRQALQMTIQEKEKGLVDFNTATERAMVQITAISGRLDHLVQEMEPLRERAAGVTTEKSPEELEQIIGENQRAIRKLGAVNMLAIEEYDRVEARHRERSERKDVLQRERTTLIERIERFEMMKYEAFMKTFESVDSNFREVFARLTAGSGHLVLENEEDPFNGGLSFAVQPQDKTVHLLSALSGGEKSLVTLAFIFAIQKAIPAPFYAFDEVDMSLDGSNVERIAAMIRELAGTSQFIIVSLRKPMIEGADRIMGVTIRPDKSSFVTGVKVND